MSKATDKINDAESMVTGGTPGDDILEKFKERMLTENFFKKLFGEEGNKISIDDNYSVSEHNVPVLELRIISENFPSNNTYQTGRIEARLILNNSFKGSYFKKRKLGLIFSRYLKSDNYAQIFEDVAGLRKMGTNLNIDYSKLYQVGSIALPGIKMSFDFEIDPVAWHRANPNIDKSEMLDGEEFYVDSSDFDLLIEDSDAILNSTTIYEEEV